MINLGIIGTNWITHQFVDAALDSGKYALSAVYSRKVETAQEFAGKHYGEIACETELEDFLTTPRLDVVYIASPNSLHFGQAKAAIQAGKHVIVEKPAFSTPKEMAEIIALSKENKVFFFEAARNVHEESFKVIKESLPEPKHIIGANFSYMKYSSRYDQVLEGQEPNIFSPRFSGGSLADLGVYPIYAALGWFGKPQEVHHFARKIATGVDGIGTAILRYENYDVTIQHGKIGNSALPSEIYFDNGTLYLNAINAIEKAELEIRGEETVELEVTAKANPMIEEAINFAEIIQDPDNAENQARYQELLDLARDVNEVLYELRTQAGVHYAADEE